MDKYKDYTTDLISLLKQMLERTYQEAKISTGADSEYNSGKLFAYYEVLDLIKSQSFAFQIPLEEIGLKDYNLDKFLMNDKDHTS